MRILHTSDWHLGRSFGPVSLLGDQAAFLEELVEVVVSERVELVVIAGDVYDRAIAPTEAITLFRESLSHIRATGARIVVITGNHDGADRVAPYGGLTDLAGVHVRGGYHRAGEVLTLDFPDGPLDVLPLPFLDPVLCPAPPEPDVRHTHESVLRLALAQTAGNRRSPRSLAVAHAFVTGGESSDSERLLSVGGTDQVAARTFDGCSYVALGHLHRPQSVGSPHLRYSGSPLPYSFSETQAKSLTLVDLAADGTVRIEEFPIRAGRRVHTVTGTLEELCRQPVDVARDRFVRAVLTDVGPVLDAKNRLAEVYPHVVEIELRPVRTGNVGDAHPRRGRAADPLDHALAFWAEQTDTEADDEVESLLAAALETARRALEESGR